MASMPKWLRSGPVPYLTKCVDGVVSVQFGLVSLYIKDHGWGSPTNDS